MKKLPQTAVFAARPMRSGGVFSFRAQNEEQNNSVTLSMTASRADKILHDMLTD